MKKIRRIISLILASMMICSMVCNASANSEEHTHSWVKEYFPEGGGCPEGPIATEKGCYYDGWWVTRCAIDGCKAVLRQEWDRVYEDHQFRNGVCSECGYENIAYSKNNLNIYKQANSKNDFARNEDIVERSNKLCNHTDIIENVTVERRNVDQSEYHLVVEIRKTSCNMCGKLSEDEVIIGQESHISQKDKNICTLCSAEMNCPHPEKNKITLKSFARFIDKDYHEYTYETVQRCNRCAMNVDVLNSWTEREKHDLVDYYCTDCNYTVPHCEHNTEETVIARQVISSRGEQHYSLVTWVQKCNLCGEQLGNQYSGNVMENHVYNSNGLCECGQAQDKKIGYVSSKVETDRLNVRWSPEITPNNIVGKLYLGDEVVIIGENGDFYRIEFGGDEASYVHKDYITFSKPNVSNNLSSDYLTKANAFLSDSRWKNGTTWNGNQTPKFSSYSSWGCCSYCADFVKYVFNKPSPRSGTYFTNINEIRNGDILYVTPMHWIVVLERNGNTLKTVEANWGSRVVVGNNYSISNGKLYRNGKITSTFQYGYHYLESTQAALVSSSTTSSTSQQTTQTTTTVTNKKANFVNSNLQAWKGVLDSKFQAANAVFGVVNAVNIRSGIQKVLGTGVVAAWTVSPGLLYKAFDEDVVIGIASFGVTNEYLNRANVAHNSFLSQINNGINSDKHAQKAFELYREALACYNAVIDAHYSTVSDYAQGSTYTKKMLNTFFLSVVDAAIPDITKLKKVADATMTTAELLETVESGWSGLKSYKDTVNQWNNIWDKL